MIDELDNKGATALVAERLERLHELADERWDGHHREHLMLKEAVAVADGVLNERLTKLNEFRAALTDQSRTFVTRDLYDKLEEQMGRRFVESSKLTDERYEANRKRIELLEKGDVKQEGKGLGQSSVAAAILAGIAAVASVVSILAVVLALT